MINIYFREHGRLRPAAWGVGPEGLERAVWLDLVDPDDAERDQVAVLLRQGLPEPQEVEQIEASASAHCWATLNRCCRTMHLCPTRSIS